MVNVCEQRRRGLLGGLYPEPREKAAHPKMELECQTGNLLDFLLCIS